MRGWYKEEKGLMWKLLPEVKSSQSGKVGPAFGIGAGCGVGFAVGFVGGIGPGIPGLQFGFGLGVGCGVGLGFGYGVGRGIAYDGSGRHSNVGKYFHRRGNGILKNHIGNHFEVLCVHTKRLFNQFHGR